MVGLWPMDATRAWAFRRRHSLRIAFAISVFLHLVLVFVLSRIEVAPPAKPRAVAFKVVERAPAAARKPETQSGQVVDLPRPEREQAPPENARFLSAYNTRVEREQKARVRGPSRRPRTGPDASRAPDATQRPAGDAASEPKPQGISRLSGREALLRRDDPFAMGRPGLLGLSSGGAPGADGGAGAAGSGGAGGSDDALLGVDREGDTTLLNSRSFKYWDFFQRVKERVRQEWDPATVYRARDPTGSVYGQRDRLTVLAVVLDRDGKVQRIEVIRESGLPFLDEEAIRAFREAAPFLNPPKGLADEQGRIAFHFGFILDLTSSRARFFWQRP